MKLRQRSSEDAPPTLRYVSDSEEEAEEEEEEDDDDDEEEDEVNYSSRPSSDDHRTVVVFNHRRRKVQLRRDSGLSVSSPETGKKIRKKGKKERKLDMEDSLLRYTQPNVKNTNRSDVCVASPLDDNLVVADSDEDFMKAGKNARKKKKKQDDSINGTDEQKTSVGIQRIGRARSAPRKSYKEVSSDGGSEEEGDEHPAQKSKGFLLKESEDNQAPQKKGSATPSDLSVFSFNQETVKSLETKTAENPRKVILKPLVSVSSSKKCKARDGKKIRHCQEEEGSGEKINSTVPFRQSRRLAERTSSVKCLKDAISGDDDDDDEEFGSSSDKTQSISHRSNKTVRNKETLPDKKKRDFCESNCGSARHLHSSAQKFEVDQDEALLEPYSRKIYESISPKLEVDKYGLKISECSPVNRLAKHVGEVEKVLSVQNRDAESASFCVKEYGKSYRSVVVVKEKLLREKCPQLLRNFLKKLDELGKSDGNANEGDNGYAFDPSYLKIARVYALEERKNGRMYYLVKWRGLTYSESTWEAKEDLIFEGDDDALARFSAINCSSSLQMFVPLSSGKISFRDGRVLRDYQEKGLEWMDHNFQNRLNCILADEMGLGKTMQAVAMLQNLRIKRRIKGPFLVIAPVSTLGHWQKEVETLTDMNCVVFSGSVEDRDIIKEYEFYYPKTKRVKFHLLLTSFEILMKEQAFLCKHDWEYVVVDEAHRLKSKDSKTTRSLKQLTIRKGGLLLLTGTPVQNNMKEIFGLLNVIDSDQFTSECDFLSKFGDLKNAEQVRDLQENILKPRLLRRLKEDVEKSIPLKEETIIWVELTKEQRCYYKAIMENRISDLLKGSLSSNMPNLRNIAMELRKLCNHPFLCNGLKEDLESRLHPNNKILDHDNHEDTAKALCLASGKMLLLDKLLPMLKSSGHRVLIFSQFAVMLDELENYLLLKNHSFERIDGSVRGSDRQAAIDRYSEKDSDTFIFLLSTRAGGLGITLTAADTCIIYDSDWNPQNDLQAMARCHRIGQKKDVRIYRLITRNTYEQHLFECSSRKYGLDEAILGSMQEKNHSNEFNENIENLLKRGAYSLLREDGEAESAAFHAQNIEQILESRTEKRLIGGRGNNTFSVATFISNPDASKQNLDAEEDPTQSWQDLLPEACSKAMNAEEQEELSCGPRKRLRVNYKERKGVSDHESSDDEYGNSKERRSAMKKGQQAKAVVDVIKNWTEREIRKLESCLIRLGRNRAEQIMIEAGIGRHSIEEVQHLCDVLIKLYQYFHSKIYNTLNYTVNRVRDVSSETSKIENSPALKWEDDLSHRKDNGWNSSTFENQHAIGNFSSASDEKAGNGDRTKVSDSTSTITTTTTMTTNGKQLPPFIFELPIIPVYAQKVMSSEIFMNKLEKRAIRNLQAIKERDILERIVKDGKIVPVHYGRSRKLPLWWSDAEDADLLLGAYRHGHRDFDKIRKDTTLCFYKRFKNLENTMHLVSHGNEVEIPTKNAVQNKSLLTDEAGFQKEETDDSIVWPNDNILTTRLKKLVDHLDIISMMPEGMRKELLLSEQMMSNGQQNILKQDNGDAVVRIPEKQSTTFNQKNGSNPTTDFDFSTDISLSQCRKRAKSPNCKWPNVEVVPNSGSESENELIHSRIVKHDAAIQEKAQKRSEERTQKFLRISKPDNILPRGKENDFHPVTKTSKEVETSSSPSVSKHTQPLTSGSTRPNLQQGVDSPILKVNTDALKRKVSMTPYNKSSSKKVNQGGKQQTLLGFLSPKCEKIKGNP